ncbi:hypothetical protein MO271_004279 [Salmonella enterica subsp. enterica]|nr:hypothetical protein [Salmonella enterica subsp. enterica]EIZ0183202.1 hypothetical protein [Salmonella enterica subsp. enterica]
MMKKVMLPADAEQYAEMVEHEISELRRKMGGACITLNYRTAIMNAHPVLVMDFFSERGRLYTLRYDLPVVRQKHRYQRLISLVLALTRKALESTGKYAA